MTNMTVISQESVPVQQQETNVATVSTETLAQWMTHSKQITRQATDIMASPLITEGYELGGHPASLAYVHLTTMALSRLKKHFPLFDEHEPAMAMLLAESKLIVAKCMLLKYECRRRRQSYNHLDDITVHINKLIHDKYTEYTNTVKKLAK